MKISTNRDRTSSRGPAEYFTGSVRIETLFQAAEPARVAGAVVTFEPGSRTAWHTHPLGQTLVILSGVCLVQRKGGKIEEALPGDVVWFEPDEVHWHGASRDLAMSHLAIQEKQDGNLVKWLNHVSDDDYVQ